MAPRGERSGMTSARNIRLFVIVDVVLVVLGVVLLLVFLNDGDGGGGAGDDAGASAGAPTPTSPSASPSATSTEPVAFALPSGNIACNMSVDGVTCTIASYTYAPPVVAGCTEVTGHV